MELKDWRTETRIERTFKYFNFLFILTESNYVRELKFTKDGKTLVSCSGDSTLRVWDVDNGV